MNKRTLFIIPVLVILIASAYAQQRETRDVGQFNKISFDVPGKVHLKQGSPQKVELVGDADVLKEIETEVEGGRLRVGRKSSSWFNWTKGDESKITVYITVANIRGISVSGSGNVTGESKITTEDIDLKVSGSGSMSLDLEARGDVEADVSGSGSMDLRGRFESLDGDVSGSGKIVLSAAIAGEAEFSISGSGKIEAKGSADIVKAAISGAGKVSAADLQTNRCDVSISGSGDVEINVVNELDARISGSGSVSYRGNPKKVNSHASGSGKVRKI